MPGSSYCISKLKIIYEVLSTEAIVINFDTGDYYSLHHIAKHVWQLLEHRIPLLRMAQLLSDYFRQDQATVQADIIHLMSELEKEGLIMPAVDADGVCHHLEEIIGEDCRHWEYSPPVIQKYVDVQRLLLIDPIHEVTEAGWPEMADERQSS